MLKITNPDISINKNTDAIKYIDVLYGVHSKEYKFFTRLILSLSVGSISLVIGSYTALSHCQSLSTLELLALAILFLSILIGIYIQYLQMMRPVSDALELSRIRMRENVSLNVKSLASKTELFLYVLQVFFFLLSFVVYGISLI